MEPFYTLLICLPAALVLIACGCGVAVLSPHTHQAKQTVGKHLWHYVVATPNRVPLRGASP